MHQEPFMEGGLQVGSLAIILFAEFATCVIVTCFNVDFLPLQENRSLPELFLLQTTILCSLKQCHC